MNRLTVLLVLIFSVSVNANVVNFDDLGSLLSGGYYYNATQPTGFQADGFQFDMALMSQSAFQNDYSNSSSFPSPSIAVYSNGAYEDNNPFSEITVYRTDDAKFDFFGAQIGGFTYQNTIAWYAATDVLIEGYRDGSFVGSVNADPLVPGFNYVAADLYNVDTLKFYPTQGSYDYSQYGLTNSGTGSYWMMDDFTYSVVPVPGAVLLGSIGLGLSGWLTRRRLA